MANPMSITEYNGIDGEYQTYKADNSTITYDATKAGGSASVGLAVTMVGQADGVVALCSDNDKVHGKLIKVESDLFCTVQTEGYCTLPGGNGATLTIGSEFLGALGAASAKGYIKAGTTAGSARGAIVNNDVTTAVVVNLDS